MGPKETLDLDDLEIHLSEAIKVAVDHIRNISNNPVVPQTHSTI